MSTEMEAAAATSTAKPWFKMSWSTITILGLAAIAIVAVVALVMQNSYATIGRQTHRNVTKFLIDNGAVIQNGVISGGILTVPMKVNTAVNSTVVTMLNAFADQMVAPQESSDEMRPPPSSPTTASSTPAPRPRARAPSEGLKPSPEMMARAGTDKVVTASVSDYNPNDVAPQNTKPPDNIDIFNM